MPVPFVCTRLTIEALFIYAAAKLHQKCYMEMLSYTPPHGKDHKRKAADSAAAKAHNWQSFTKAQASSMERQSLLRDVQ
jgi:hypothetical protein